MALTGTARRAARPSGWAVAAVVVALLLVAPLLALPASFIGESDAFGQISGTLLPDALKTSIYLAFGVGCMLVYQPVWSNVPSSALWLILVGGCVYTAGIPFYLLERLRFQQVIWHGFVWTATTCHYFALLNCISQLHL